jgi:hypothetical protein
LEWHVPFRISNINFVRIYHFHACFVPGPSHPPWFDSEQYLVKSTNYGAWRWERTEEINKEERNRARKKNKTKKGNKPLRCVGLLLSNMYWAQRISVFWFGSQIEAVFTLKCISST